MKVPTSRPTAVVALLVALGVLLVGAACDGSAPTAPSRFAPRPQAGASADEIQGDTLTCRSGWQIIEGRYVCN